MSATDIAHRLQTGIAAAKAGEREKAHSHLMDVLRLDEENELAWLWLSGVVEAVEDRRICLENVLTLNPENQIAQRGLEKLENLPVEAAAPHSNLEEKVIRREFTPVSPAQSILYPERLVQEVRWQEPVVEQKAARAEYKSISSYDDVWSRNEDLCAYCAHRLAADDTHCQKCKRKLISHKFSYEKPSSDMHIYWVMLVGLGQLFLIEAIVNIILGENYFVAGGYGLLLLIFWGLGLGVYFRQSWAHVSSIFMLVVVLLGFLLNNLIDFDMSALGLGALDSSIQDFVGPLVGGMLEFLKVFEIITAVLGLFYGIFKAGPDFERVQTRLTASITKGRRTAADYHTIANRLSKKGLWASAILHWQRAAAQEPGQVMYQKQLGLAYSRLGFYHRGLDTLQSAHDISSYPPIKSELAHQVEMVKQKLANQLSETADSVS